MPCAACQSRRISAPLSSNGLTGKIDASLYRGNPVDNPGLPSYIERTVINDKIGGSLAYPILLSNTQSMIGTASIYASHDEDRYRNEQTGAQIGFRHSDAKHYNLDLSVAKPIGDAPVESASRSPRINATFS
jgi:hypothetical protein